MESESIVLPIERQPSGFEKFILLPTQSQEKSPDQKKFFEILRKTIQASISLKS